MFTGKKTKIAAMGLAISGILVFFFPVVAMSIALFSMAVGFYGLYDRTNRVENRNNENIAELKQRIKKPRLAGS